MGEQRHPLPLVIVGLVAGIAAFVGCFLHFFSGAGSGSIVQAGSFWFAVTPALLALATIGLLVPRLTVTSVLPLGAVGLALGFKASVDSLNFAQVAQNVNGVTGGTNGVGQEQINHTIHTVFGPGVGFYLIVIAGTVLALVWARIVHDMVVVHFGSFSELFAARKQPA